MPSSSISPIQAIFVVPPQVHLLDLTGPAQLFYEAQTFDAPVKLFFCNLHQQEQTIQSSSNLFLSQLTNYQNLSLQKGDIIFIPGLESSLLLTDDFLHHTSRPFQEWLIEQHKKEVMIASICTGAFLLAETGLLDHQECTTHWNYMERLASQFPLTRPQHNRLFTHSGNLFTSAGVTAGIDLSLYILELLFGPVMATQVAKEVVVYSRRTASDPQLSIFMQYRNHLDERIHQVQDILAQTLHQKWNIDMLAERVHMSGRNLTRLFRKTTQVSIGQYIDQLRKERARQLLREGHTMQAAANLCGLKSTNQLRQLLHRK